MGASCIKSSEVIETGLCLVNTENIVVRNEYSKKLTASSYLMKMNLDISEVPLFVIQFYGMVNENQYDSCLQNQYKDLYFCYDVVFSVEITKPYIYKNVETLSEVTRIMNHVMTPSHVYYHPLNEVEGILFQKMLRCNQMDLFGQLFESEIGYIDIDNLIYTLCYTLRSLHRMNIYLMDIKLENIFGHYYDDKIIWMFADTEYAFVNAPFIEEDEQHANPKEIFRARCFRKFQWIKTPQYLPDWTYPYSRKIAERNDCFALARCIGMVITLMETGGVSPLFYEKRKDINDIRDYVMEQCKDNKYIRIG